MTLERRFTAGIAARAEADTRTLKGYAAIFNSPADIGGYFREQIAPGAFAGALASDVRALIDHDTGRVIGRSTAGTLRMMEDDRGLAVEIDLPDTTDGRDLWTLVDRGDVSGMSFGFQVTKQAWDETGDTPLRTIEAVNLFEVSAVAFPAYDDTSIATRSLAEFRASRIVTSRAALIGARLRMDMGLRSRRIA